MRILLVQPGASVSVSDVHNGLVHGFQNLGHEVIKYPLDARIYMSGKWLHFQWKERGADPAIKPNSADVLYLAGQGVLERALRHDVDWVIVTSGMYFHPAWLELIHKAKLKLGVVFTESPYDDDQQVQVAPFADLCWTNERSSVPLLKQANPNVKYLPPAFDPVVHRPGCHPGDEDYPEHDVVFVGTMFKERIEMLARVDWTGIDLGLYGEMAILGSRSPLRRYVRAKVIPNTQAAALYRRAKIGLNLFRTSKGFGWKAESIQRAESVNPRVMELAGCGVFYLSDYRPEVTEIFGELVPTFTNAADLERLIRHYLPLTGQRRRLAAQLPLAVAHHTFDERARQIASDIAEWERSCPQ